MTFVSVWWSEPPFQKAKKTRSWFTFSTKKLYSRKNWTRLTKKFITDPRNVRVVTLVSLWWIYPHPKKCHGFSIQVVSEFRLLLLLRMTVWKLTSCLKTWRNVWSHGDLFLFALWQILSVWLWQISFTLFSLQNQLAWLRLKSNRGRVLQLWHAKHMRCDASQKISLSRDNCWAGNKPFRPQTSFYLVSIDKNHANFLFRDNESVDIGQVYLIWNGKIIESSFRALKT